MRSLVNFILTQTQYVNWIEEKWRVRVDESTITRILKSKNKRLGTEIANPEVKCHKSVLVPELELALKKFVLNYQYKTILSDGVLTKKAKQLADKLNIPQEILRFSSGWLQKFKAVIIFGRNKCSKYLPERIYNMDETGLFYQNLPMTYQNNSKAWMLTTLFQEWLQEFDYQVVCFLPPNTTSKLQLMDAGIIMSFKKHYRDDNDKDDNDRDDNDRDDNDRGDDDNDRDDDDRDDDDDNNNEDDNDNRGDDDDDDDSVLDDNLNKAIKALYLSNMMQLKEFLTIPKENIVYKISEDEIISELANIF
ncbi:unnamed protein product [Rhizophagus irregularis]|nr:unnamed protein product [Rhizophagus irregularis]